MVIYLVQHEEIPKFTKIGITNDMKKRIRSLQTSSPTEIKVLYQKEIPKASQVEKILHNRYRHKHSSREWFKLDNNDIWDIINFIETVTK